MFSWLYYRRRAREGNFFAAGDCDGGRQLHKALDGQSDYALTDLSTTASTSPRQRRIGQACASLGDGRQRSGGHVNARASGRDPRDAAPPSSGGDRPGTWAATGR